MTKEKTAKKWRVSWETRDFGQSEAGHSGKGNPMFYSFEAADKKANELMTKYPYLMCWAEEAK